MVRYISYRSRGRTLGRLVSKLLVLVSLLLSSVTGQAQVSSDVGVPLLVEVSERPSGKDACLGAELGRGYVLAARHCLTSPKMYVRRVGDLAKPKLAVIVWQSRTRDVGLLRGFDRGLRDWPSLRGKMPKVDGQQSLWVATRTGLAPATVVTVLDGALDVRVPTRALCFGDSGAPLLSRQPSGWAVVGVLSAGMPDCAQAALTRFVVTSSTGELRAHFAASGQTK